MSQSELHRNLVLQVAEKLKSLDPQIRVLTDVQDAPGDEVPPLINGFRPDIYVRRESNGSVIIAEAKTDDLDYQHTHEQIVSFINYLEKRENGVLVLAATGQNADHAKTVLRFICKKTRVFKTNIMVFDTLDLWLLDSHQVTWDLY
ncbi:MAG: hypothetical protein OXC38_09745 [Gammaproteobacteria bacterium]|nr:hypothetical protein [Gammaproteobacteria bacterium]